MSDVFNADFSREIEHGETFSLFLSEDGAYWTVYNKDPSISGKYNYYSYAKKMLDTTNEFANYLKSKGVSFYD